MSSKAEPTLSATRSTLRRAAARAGRALLAVAFFVSLTGALLEASLRLAPAAIPASLLKRFQPDVRLAIARRLGLPNTGQTRLLARDDGGPPLRLFEPFSRIRFVYEDTGESGEMVMDGLGFCNAREDDYRRERISLIAIGDSFTVCHPPAPEVAWPSALGRLLGMSAYNLGRGGYGPYEYVQLLRAIGLAKRPEVVVLSFYEGNDLRDAVRHHAHARASAEERARFSERGSLASWSVSPSPALETALGRCSHAYNLAVVGGAWAASRALDAWRGERKARVNFRYALRFPDATVAMNVRNTDQDEARSARAVAAGELDFTPVDAALEAFAALGAAHRFRAIVAYTPSAHTAYAEFAQFEDAALRPVMRAFSEAQRAHLRALCERLRVEFIDLTPALRAAARRDRESRLLYFPINVHFTPAGHAVAAAALAEALKRPAAARAQLAGSSAPTMRAAGWRSVR